MPHWIANVLVGGAMIIASAGVDLGGVFGLATASATQSSAERIELDLSVEAESGEAVIAHLIEPGGEQQALPLPETADGEYRIIVDVRKVNYIVVFELLGGEVSSQSQPSLLTDLGVAPAVLGIITSPRGDASEPNRSNAWGWAGLGLGALSLLALAIWAMPGRDTENAKTQIDDTL